MAASGLTRAAFSTQLERTASLHWAPQRPNSWRSQRATVGIRRELGGERAAPAPIRSSLAGFVPLGRSDLHSRARESHALESRDPYLRPLRSRISIVADWPPLGAIRKFGLSSSLVVCGQMRPAPKPMDLQPAKRRWKLSLGSSERLPETLGSR